MSKRRNRAINVIFNKHGVAWWIFVGWWWRPIVYLGWLFYNIIFNQKVVFKKRR